MEYRKYMESDAWRRNPARLKALDEAREHCRLCGNKAPLEVHHASYERLGDEQNNDLVALCCPCHREVTCFLRARRYATVEPKHADVIRLRDERIVQVDPTASAY